MADSDSAPPKLDANTRMAYERTYLAHERTQMGWVRTALALISFGFTIAKFFELIREKNVVEAPRIQPKTIGVLMIASGLVALLLSDIQHRKAMRIIRQQCPGLPPSLAGITAAFIALAGVLALLGALWRI